MAGDQKAIDVQLDPDLAPVSREMLHEQIYNQMKRNLMMGRFVPGQKLPLRGLAQSLGTSLMPVRDALQRLESVGCVVSAANRTMMVPEFSAKQLGDICTLRIILEGAAAEQAAVHRSEKELEILLSYVEEIEKSTEQDDVDLFLEANYHFHMQVAEMSKISFIKNILEPLWMHIGPSVRRTVPNQALFFISARRHRDVYDAIVSRDGGAAAEAMRMDILEGTNF
ncbi:GntR family transcriptional regulator [Jiella sp. MQZ9-1]|uniref:GntR family transcriptional regulator n=1 Tax=Jiella flava TaxID=2816857 RepID=A0A939JVM1_9HYPH|nr:GntR family transcriptional regulator [Jiella flava]MBO0661416.1 GntR family transcriptional regulator [Jiella flava]MCD2470059.1 GntR family transcriptional regulator [Jiella flava]